MPQDSTVPNSVLLTGLDLSDYFDGFFYGSVIAAGLFGIIIVQSWIYFNSKRDKLLLRCFVAVLVLLGFVATCLDIQGLHHYLVQHFGDLKSLALITKPLIMEYLMILIIVFSVELFLASRVWLLQRCHWTVPVLIVLCALGSVSAGISTIVGLLKNNVDTLNILQMNKQRIEIVCTCALSSFADVIATVALLWSLSSSRAGIQRTNTLLRKLCQYFVTRGLFVSLYQIVLLIIFLAFPQKLWWMLLFFTISQVYIITMLAILNSRDNLRGNSSTGVINGSEMQFESDFSNNSFPNAGRGQTYGMASLHASRKSDHNVDFVPFQSSASVTQGEGGSDSYNLAH